MLPWIHVLSCFCVTELCLLCLCVCCILLIYGFDHVVKAPTFVTKTYSLLYCITELACIFDHGMIGQST